MTTARGTMGYIAPEMLSRNLGNVSYKVPVDRPSMKLVVQMLEGEHNLSTPPNPFTCTSPTKQMQAHLKDTFNKS
ncbi:hypothetical protein CK203_036247 [Vitis vinifera]|uniref:Protein kinase domain-containing protein n=1 Tax=Vitis vinifera TaxID=29760 RepID=A0A438HSM2_VITVI|nr:hypothetical protein CK203_036247 [Vitis vinifera]